MPAALRADFQQVLQLTPRLLEELMKVLELLLVYHLVLACVRGLTFLNALGSMLVLYL